MRRVRLILLAFWMASCLGLETAWAQTRYAAAVDIQGDPQIQQRDGAWRSLGPGMQLREGDRIRTASNATVILAIVDGNRKIGQLKIRENSEMVLQQMSPDPETGRESTLLDLALGNVLLYVRTLQDDSSFKVRTPVSISGVRGTSFGVQYDRRGSFSETAVYEGVVILQPLEPKTGMPLGQPILAQEGKRARVEAAAGVAELTSLSNQELDMALREIERLRFSSGQESKSVDRRPFLVTQVSDSSGGKEGVLPRFGFHLVGGGLLLLGFFLFISAVRSRSMLGLLIAVAMIAGGIWLFKTYHLSWEEFTRLAPQVLSEL